MQNAPDAAADAVIVLLFTLKVLCVGGGSGRGFRSFIVTLRTTLVYQTAG